jgi:RNA polymerase sigma-70 factor (ECF subfamily)
MNGMDQSSLIDRIDKLSARRSGQPANSAHSEFPGAFADLYTAYSQRLYKTILTITKNHEDAEDALQEAFLRVHLRLQTFEGRSSIYSWLTRIAINSALMVLRRRRSRPETLFDPQQDTQEGTPRIEIAESSPNPEQICDWRQRSVRVLDAIHSLDPHLQAPIRMRMMDSSMKEICCALNLSQAAVKARLHRARRRLFLAPDVLRSEHLRRSVDFKNS